MNKYRNQAITNTEVIEELIRMAKEIKEMRDKERDLGLNDDKVAFYGALTADDAIKEFMDDETLKKIVHELTSTIKNNITIDWSIRKSAQAGMRKIIKRLLKKYDYPPNQAKHALEVVMCQAELMCGYEVFHYEESTSFDNLRVAEKMTILLNKTNADFKRSGDGGTKMELEEILSILKMDFPNKAIDVSESLELLKETINETMIEINNKISDVYSKRDFESGRKYMQLGEDINKYEQKIDQFIGVLEVDVLEERIEDEDLEEVEKRSLPDYTAYYVDTNVEHTLYENFTHKRPYAFRINDNNIIEVKTWQEILIKTCELLIAVDSDKFASFENKPAMNGKKRKYFSSHENDMRKPRLVCEKIFVETNISGNGVRNLLLKLLKEYGYKSSEFKVYLKADYTEIHS